jgi:ATP-binding cassette subfamily B protein
MLTTYAWPHRVSFAAGFGMLAATNWLTVEIPVRVGNAIDLYAGGADPVPTILLVGMMGLAVILVRTLSRVWIFNPGRSAEYALRKDLFAHLMALRPQFYAGRSTGDIISRASSDITYARVLTGFGLMQSVNVTLALTFTAWKLISLSPGLTVWAVIPILVGMVVVRSAISRIFTLHQVAQEKLSTLSDHILGSFQGIATIQGFNAEPRFEARAAKLDHDLFQTRFTASALSSLAFPALTLAGSASVFALLYVGGPMAIRGDLSVGNLVAFQGLLLMLLSPLRSMGWMISVFQRGHVSLTRIFELIDAPVERPEGDEPYEIPTDTGPGFSVRDLRFAYPDAPDKMVLSDVSIEIPGGSVVGLFGRTGSGKSTFIRMLTREYDPPPGTIHIQPTTDAAPVDVTAVDLRAWRARLAVAPQRPFLFSDSIGENIELSARPQDLAHEGIEPIHPARRDEAAHLAALSPDLEALPEGIETVVGERGIMLSGGQRQRAALARALYKKGDIIILDDVLSAVDHETEHHLVQALSSLRTDGQRPTTFIASHRLSALRQADLVLVFDEGRLIDQGSHSELVARPGPYRETWLAQRPDGAQASEVAS